MIQKLIPNNGDFRIILIKNKIELVIKVDKLTGENLLTRSTF